jgi:hypothetical protein
MCVERSETLKDANIIFIKGVVFDKESDFLIFFENAAITLVFYRH